jgi:hypothetical protein
MFSIKTIFHNGILQIKIMGPVVNVSNNDVAKETITLAPAKYSFFITPFTFLKSNEWQKHKFAGKLKPLILKRSLARVQDSLSYFRFDGAFFSIALHCLSHHEE